MNRSIDQALGSLLPTLNEAVPPSLVQLATALLAQSRHRASTLKAEEEVARLHACAHIACDRLKIALNLPPIESRPPIPPRIYKRLYNHLDKILPAGPSPGRTTSGSKRREAASSPVNHALPSRTAPSKQDSLAPFRSASASGLGKTPKRGQSIKTPTSRGRQELPLWVRPTLRILTRELGEARIGPTVIAAMEQIVVPHGRLTGDEWVKGNLVSLLGALYMYAWRSVSMPPEGLDEQRYAHARKQVVEAFRLARSSLSLENDERGEAWEGWQDIKGKDLDATALWISRHGWLESDWAKDLNDLAPLPEGDIGSVSTELAELQVRKPDTMFQDKVDFLSQRNRREYAAWKEALLHRIEGLEETRD
ncbi:hypothetical protein GQ53DRAFT_752926 [Thozetella sp. PMI_491]|nr:hypothetical protein GQ53DRAFT_752926 [Thozetella sp. PMI_491]